MMNKINLEKMNSKCTRKNRKLNENGTLCIDFNNSLIQSDFSGSKTKAADLRIIEF